MPINFAYQPPYGPLSGTEFEKQTAAFFEAVQNDYTEKLSAISVAVNQIRQEVAAIRGAVEDNANAITALQQRCMGIEADVAANAEQLASQAQQISDLSSTLSSVSGRVTTLETAVGALQTLTGQQGDDIAALQSTTGSLQTTTAEQAGRLDGLDTLTAQQGGDITTLKTLTDTHTTQISTLRSDVGTPKLTGYTAGNLRYIRKS